MSHEETKTKWKRVAIRDVQDRDHEVGRVNPPPHPHKTLKKGVFSGLYFYLDRVPFNWLWNLLLSDENNEILPEYCQAQKRLTRKQV